MGSYFTVVAPEVKVFHTRITNISAIVSGANQSGDSDPYIVGDFDGYRTFTTPTIKHTTTPQWGDGFQVQFNYETAYVDCLHVKSLFFTVYDANRVEDDIMLGRCSIDLHSLCTGPSKIQLDLELNNAMVGTLSFECTMNEVREMPIELKMIRVIPPTVGRAPLPSIMYLKYCTKSYEPGVRTTRSFQVEGVPTGQPHLTDSFETVYYGGTLDGLTNECIYLHLYDASGSPYASGNVRLAPHPEHKAFLTNANHSYLIGDTIPLTPFGGGSGGEEDTTTDYGKLEIALMVLNCPTMAQMPLGVNENGVVYDGTPLMEGLPLPRQTALRDRTGQV
eukprot:PhF_6_TR6182/c0_g1_i2/m.9271